MSSLILKLFKKKDYTTNSQPTEVAKDIKNKEKITIIHSFSQIATRAIAKSTKTFYATNFGNVALGIIMSSFTVFHIIFIDFNSPNFVKFKKRTRNDSKVISYLCDTFENNYLFEELLYLPFSLLFLAFLILKQKNRRFGYFLEQKFQKNRDVFKQKNADYSPKIPSFSFSTLNRSQSAAIYVIYT